MDSAALSFLTALALEAKRNEEEARVEQAQEEEHVPESIQQVQGQDPLLELALWLDRLEPSSVFERNAEERVWCWHMVCRVSCFNLLPLPSG